MDPSSIKYNQKTNQLNLKSFIMKKTAVVLALALGFSISNLNASNEILTSNVNEVNVNEARRQGAKIPKNNPDVAIAEITKPNKGSLR